MVGVEEPSGHAGDQAVLERSYTASILARISSQINSVQADTFRLHIDWARILVLLTGSFAIADPTSTLELVSNSGEGCLIVVFVPLITNKIPFYVS